MTMLCRDEEDIVGYNIAYHLMQGIDFVIATDNASNDRTPQLLGHFAKLGKLHLIHEPSRTHDQAVWVTRMARMAASRFGADWVINNDADEFWLSSTGTVRTALESISRETECLAVPRFDMAPSRDSNSRFFEAMTIRLESGKSIYGMRLRPKTCHRAFHDIRVADGNHSVKRRGERLRERTDHTLQILHFPVRSAAQFERKIRQGSEALRANTRVTASTGGHWHLLYRNYVSSGRVREYYDGLVPSQEQLAAGLENGAFAEDARIRNALRQLDSRLTDPDSRQ
jgi:hypothetical protein